MLRCVAWRSAAWRGVSRKLTCTVGHIEKKCVQRSMYAGILFAAFANSAVRPPSSPVICGTEMKSSHIYASGTSSFHLFELIETSAE